MEQGKAIKLGLITGLFMLPMLSAQAITPSDWLAKEELKRLAPTVEKLAIQTARNYRAQARYPQDSNPLLTGQADSVKAGRTPQKNTFKSRRHQSTHGQAQGVMQATDLTVWSGQISFEFPHSVELFAKVSVNGQTFMPEGISGELVDSRQNSVRRFLYLDDGRGTDRKADDGIFSARLKLKQAPELADLYQVKVQAFLGADLTQKAIGGFIYSKPWAQLTGRYIDSLQDGNVLVSAQIEVEKSGRFYLEGSLHSLKGEPIGVARAAANLKPGKQWITLKFYGLMFHERQIEGAFKLGSLALSTTSGMPNALNYLQENVHVTQSYKLSDLNANPFNEPSLIKTALQLESAK